MGHERPEEDQTKEGEKQIRREQHTGAGLRHGFEFITSHAQGSAVLISEPRPLGSGTAPLPNGRGSDTLPRGITPTASSPHSHAHPSAGNRGPGSGTRASCDRSPGGAGSSR